MKKVVLSLALVAMMFVSCKEAEAQVEETPVVEETVEVVEEATEEVADSAAVVTEEVAQ